MQQTYLPPRVRSILIAQKNGPRTDRGPWHCAMRILPSDGNDALAHDARRIRFGDLSEATTMRCFAGDQLLNAHVHFLFVDFQDECASIRTKNRCEAKNSIIVQDSYSQPKPPDEHNPRQSAMHTARLAHWINDGLGERECGHQQHERRGVGSEASLMAAWMLIRSCIFCIGP